MCLLYFFVYSLLFLPFSSVLLSYFILAVPMRECLGKHSRSLCMSSTLPIGYSHTEWNLLVSDSVQCVFGSKKKKYLSTIKLEPLN